MTSINIATGVHPPPDSKENWRPKYILCPPFTHGSPELNSLVSLLEERGFQKHTTYSCLRWHVPRTSSSAKKARAGKVRARSTVSFLYSLADRTLSSIVKKDPTKRRGP